jgi:hypothetical protein
LSLNTSSKTVLRKFLLPRVCLVFFKARTRTYKFTSIDFINKTLVTMRMGKWHLISWRSMEMWSSGSSHRSKFSI